MIGNGGRRLELVSMLVDGGDGAAPEAALKRACAVGPDLCGVSGMAVSLVSDHGPGLVVCASDPMARTLEGLQSSLGEGPGLHARADGLAVLEGDLETSTLWTHYSEVAVRAGVRAVFGFALQIGAVKLGAMTMYRDRRGDLSAVALSDAVILSEIVTSLVLAINADGDGWSPADLDDLDGGWLVVHQATGMVSVQLQVGVETALARLRAHAYTAGRSLGDVAGDIVARRLRLEPDDP